VDDPLKIGCGVAGGGYAPTGVYIVVICNSPLISSQVILSVTRNSRVNSLQCWKGSKVKVIKEAVIDVGVAGVVAQKE
jgi:hypothetical protein